MATIESEKLTLTEIKSEVARLENESRRISGEIQQKSLELEEMMAMKSAIPFLFEDAPATTWYRYLPIACIILEILILIICRK